MPEKPPPTDAATALPPYSGPDVVCTMCGNVGAFTEHRGYGRCLHDLTDTVVGFDPNHRLHRRCDRCDYAWDEAVVVTGGAS